MTRREKHQELVQELADARRAFHLCVQVKKRIGLLERFNTLYKDVAAFSERTLEVGYDQPYPEKSDNSVVMVQHTKFKSTT